MLARHRRAHGRIWPLLALLLAAGFVAGLAVRQGVPIDDTAIPEAPATEAAR